MGGLSKFFLEEDIQDVIMCFKFGDDRLRGLASAEGQILPLPIDFDGCPYNTLTLPCDSVNANNIGFYLVFTLSRVYLFQLFLLLTACAVATSCCISDESCQWEKANFDPHSSNIY